MAAAEKKNGRTLIDRLTDLSREFGLHSGHQESRVLKGPQGAAQMAAILAGLRKSPPMTVDGVSLVAMVDLKSGRSTSYVDGVVAPVVELPTSNVLAFYYSDGSRILARPSGTEPKIKFYFELVSELGNETLAVAKKKAEPPLSVRVQAFMALALSGSS